MVGLLMALLVIGGFGLIYVFVFDAEMQGRGKSIEAVVRTQGEDIEILNLQIEQSKKTIDEGDKLISIGKKADELSKALSSGTEAVTKAQEKAGELKKDISGTEEAFDSYKGEYRNFVRTKAVGEEMEELTVKSGETFKNVMIREVTDVGIQIRHTDGTKRVAFEDLSAEHQERFQFDPEEKARALAKEEEARRLAEQAVAQEDESGGAATIAASGISSMNFEGAEGQRLLGQAIRAKEIQLAKLRTEKGVLEGEAVKVEGNAEDRRSRGINDMKRVRDFRTRIQAKEREIANVVRELAALKTKKRQD